MFDRVLNLPDSELASVVTSEIVLPAVVVAARLLWVLSDVVIVMTCVISNDIIIVVVGAILELVGTKRVEVTPKGMFTVVFIADELLWIVNSANVGMGSEVSDSIVIVTVGFTLCDSDKTADAELSVVINVDDVSTVTIGITDDEEASVSDGSDSALDIVAVPEDWINASVVVSKSAVDIVLSL